MLVADDEAAVRDSLARTLRFEGYDVVTARDGCEALTAVREQEPNALVLDVSMPRLDGLQACRELRADGVWLPVLMLTARDSVGDRVAGIDAGADDYLVKPFALQELLARVRALLRRSLLVAVPASEPQPMNDSPAPDELVFADLHLNPGTRDVRRGDRPLRLTRTEFSILEVCLRHPRQVRTRPVLMDQVWASGLGKTSNSLHVY